MVTKILLDSTHFNEIRHAIRSRSVAWDAIARESEMDSNDVAVAKQLEEALSHETSEGVQRSSIIVDGTVIKPLIHFLKTTSNGEARKYVTNLLAELLSSDLYAQDTITYLQNQPNQVKELYNVMLKTDDMQTNLIAAFNMVSLLIQPGIEDPDMVDHLLSNQNLWNILHDKEQMESRYASMRLLQELASIKEYRSIIWTHRDSFLKTVFEIINDAIQFNTKTKIVATNSNNLGIQLQYYSLMLLWLLTFDPAIAYELTQNYLSDFLNLLNLVKVTIKEKISRLCFAIILQCCSKNVKAHKQLIKKLLLLGNTLPVLQSLSERKYSDDELREDMLVLKEILECEYKELTSFDEYLAELDSKLFCWSPTHIDNGFWSDNVDKFKQQNWKLFKQLVELLIEVSNDKKIDSTSEKQKRITIEVALSDITHIVDLLPESVHVLSEMKGKIVIMQLLAYPDSRVKYEALKATQTIIGYNHQ